MATLEDVNPLAVPIGNMMPIGRDELGNPVYRNALTGATYMLTQPQPDQGGGFSWGGMMNALAAPFRLAGGRGTDADVAAVENALAGVLQGATAPGRAAMGEPVTLGDVWSTALDYGIAGAPMAAPEGALRAGAVATEAKTAAQNVADLLRQGRASEVTDAMIAQVDPQEMWRLYENGATGMEMPMDAASRMARAREMGFDTGTQLYHGTGADFQAFDRNRFQQSDFGTGGAGIYSTQDQGLAGAYADLVTRPSNENAQIFPVYTRRTDAFDNGGFRNINSAEDARAYSERMQSLGVDNVYYTDPMTGQIIENITFDPRNLRSFFARFDPRLSHLGNLSAGAAGAYYAIPTSDQRQGN